MSEVKKFEDTPENNEKMIGDLLISKVEIANVINAKATGGGSDAWRFLQMASEVQLGTDGLGKDIHIHFHGGEEKSIDNWNPDIAEFQAKRAKDTNAFRTAIEFSGLLSNEQKEALLGINEEALRSIARDMKMFHDENIVSETEEQEDEQA